MDIVLIPNLLFILWNQTPEIWPDGSIPFRWYGLLFALGFLFGQMIITRIFKAEGKSEKDVDALTFYMITATVVGARLGHCLFYQPDYYLAHPIEIFKIWEGGLASHGATVGILVAMWLYSRKRPDQSWLWILDRIVIVVALGGAFIRTGNLMNSEILGKPTDLPWGVVFLNQSVNSLKAVERDVVETIAVEKGRADTVLNGETLQPVNLLITFKRDAMPGTSVQAYLQSALPLALVSANRDERNVEYFPELAQARAGHDASGKNTLSVRVFGVPRHPSMMYEALSTLLLFVVLYLYWSRNVGRLPEGRLFSIFVVVLFTLRFFYEFLKENQVEFESQLPLNMGQILSIPLVVFGIYLFIKTLKTNPNQDFSTIRSKPTD